MRWRARESSTELLPDMAHGHGEEEVRPLPWLYGSTVRWTRQRSTRRSCGWELADGGATASSGGKAGGVGNGEQRLRESGEWRKRWRCNWRRRFLQRARGVEVSATAWLVGPAPAYGLHGVATRQRRPEAGRPLGLTEMAIRPAINRLTPHFGVNVFHNPMLISANFLNESASPKYQLQNSFRVQSLIRKV